MKALINNKGRGYYSGWFALIVILLLGNNNHGTKTTFGILGATGFVSKVSISRQRSKAGSIATAAAQVATRNTGIQRFGFATSISRSSSPYKISSSSSSLTRVYAKNGNKNDNDDEENTNLYKELKEKIDGALQELQSKLPLPIRTKLIPWFISIQGQLKLGLTAFTAGIIFTVAAVFVPVYSQVEELTEPVQLFETILTDLEQGYVDKVDTKKLFETGVSAMLGSLDPYTEFEPRQQAESLNESIEGRYGGVGLVIAGRSTESVKKMEQQKIDMSKRSTKPVPSLQNKGSPNSKKLDINNGATDDDGLEDYDADMESYELSISEKQQKQGIQVVSAFEGYAFDYGMRVGDKLVAIGNKPVTDSTSVEDVRNLLRGRPGSDVTISFEREGVEGVQDIVMPRQVIRLRDVKLATLIGKKQDGVGYIQLSGFTSDAGKEVRNAILNLQAQALDASDGKQQLQGLVLDLRGNPGGLLTSAVDVSSLVVPKGSDIVAARGRGFPGIKYQSRLDPLLDTSKTRLAVLVNANTASAAEIVSGAVQDLDVGVIIGTDRTYGKGLVQNVEPLPYSTALKFTVAKYYTPSGRCIQGVNYSEGGGAGSKDLKYIESKVKEEDRTTYYTTNGRIVKDGGGVEADYKVSTPKSSALEVTLIQSGVLQDFAAEWSRSHQLTNNFEVDDETYRQFQKYVTTKQSNGDIKLERIYLKGINDLKRVLKLSGYKGSEKELVVLKETIIREVFKDFDKYRSDIKEDISQTILARYLPESMLLERSIKNDKQVEAAINLLLNEKKFDALLAKDGTKKNAEKKASILTNGASSILPLKQPSISKIIYVEQDGGTMAKVDL